MTTHDDGGLAYPRMASDCVNLVTGKAVHFPAQEGMTLHDWYAGQAPKLPEGVLVESAEAMRRKDATLSAVEALHLVLRLWGDYHADAMIAEKRRREALP